jgi:hypothetical protein
MKRPRLIQVHVVMIGSTRHFSDFESALHFLWLRSLLLASVRDALKTVDRVADSLLN